MLRAARALQARASAYAAAQVPDPYKSRAPIAGVFSIIAVTSAKGGVGKSTTAANLAVASVDLGLKVGLLDADIYGPSVPLLMGVKGAPKLNEKSQMIPHVAHGVSCMSMGFLMKDDSAATWRGPMVMGALEKLIRGTEWGKLDVLFVDMPPGTGDAHISVSQKLPLAGVVIVSTPQEMALIDARRGVDMYRKVGVDILGMVENMAYLELPGGGHQHIFGEGGVRRAAEQAGVELLGEVPLDMAIRVGSDAGLPVAKAEAAATTTAAAAGGGAVRAVYRDMAVKLARKVGLM